MPAFGTSEMDQIAGENHPVIEVSAIHGPGDAGAVVRQLQERAQRGHECPGGAETIRASYSRLAKEWRFYCGTNPGFIWKLDPDTGAWI